MESSSLLKSPSFIIFLTIILIVCVATIKNTFFSQEESIPAPEASIVNAPVNAADNADIDEDVKRIKGVYLEQFAGAIDEVGDEEFSNYVLEKLEPVCPYYEPSGVAYRNCLYDFVENKKDNFKGDIVAFKKIENYCAQISKEYDGTLMGISLYGSCMAYKLDSFSVSYSNARNYIDESCEKTFDEPIDINWTGRVIANMAGGLDYGIERIPANKEYPFFHASLFTAKYDSPEEADEKESANEGHSGVVNIQGKWIGITSAYANMIYGRCVPNVEIDKIEEIK